MDIGRILNLFSSPQPGSSPKSFPVAAENATAEASSGAATLGPEQSRKFRDVVSQYDLTDISPQELSELVQKLQQAGVITGAEVQELAQIRLELEQDGADANESLDLVQFFNQKLKNQEEQIRRQEQRQPGLTVDRGEALRGTLRQVDWISKLAAFDSRSRFEALDAVA